MEYNLLALQPEQEEWGDECLGWEGPGLQTLSVGKVWVLCCVPEGGEACGSAFPSGLWFQVSLLHQ